MQIPQFLKPLAALAGITAASAGCVQDGHHQASEPINQRTASAVQAMQDLHQPSLVPAHYEYEPGSLQSMTTLTNGVNESTNNKPAKLAEDPNAQAIK